MPEQYTACQITNEKENPHRNKYADYYLIFRNAKMMVDII